MLRPITTAYPSPRILTKVILIGWVLNKYKYPAVGDTMFIDGSPFALVVVVYCW